MATVPEGTLCAARTTPSKAARCREIQRVQEPLRPRSGPSKQSTTRWCGTGTASKTCAKRMGRVCAFSTAGTQASHRRTVSALAQLRRTPLSACRCLTAVHLNAQPRALDPARLCTMREACNGPARLKSLPSAVADSQARRLNEPQQTAGPPARK